MEQNKSCGTVFLRFLFLILMSCCNLCYADATKKLELEQINGQIQQLKNTLDEKQKQQADLHQQLKTSEIGLATLSQEIVKINKAQIKEQKELLRLEREAQQLHTKSVNQHEALAEHLRAAYQLGKLNEVKILLNQENPNTLSRHLGYYRYLIQHRVELITEIKQTLLSLSQTMQTIAEHQTSLKSLLEQKKQQQLKQIDMQKIRQQLITQLNQEVQTKQEQLSALITNQQELQEAINQLQTQTISIPSHLSFSQLQGKLHWPVKGAITATYGSTLDVGDQHLTGVILKAPLGTPVHAISQGKIIFANWLRGFGLLVIINHGNGYMSLYARNQSISVKVGDQVKPGEIIATIGNTGGYEAASLYFEIRQNGSPVNPSLWCRYT
jgi:septal ring factor EnvC (AmiA/AmiB activator)